MAVSGVLGHHALAGLGQRLFLLLLALKGQAHVIQAAGQLPQFIGALHRHLVVQPAALQDADLAAELPDVADGPADARHNDAEKQRERRGQLGHQRIGVQPVGVGAFQQDLGLAVGKGHGVGRLPGGQLVPGQTVVVLLLQGTVVHQRALAVDLQRQHPLLPHPPGQQGDV